VFPVCDGHLVVFTDRDDPQGVLLRADDHVPRLPDRWEVEAYRRSRRDAARSGRFVPPQSVQEYARTPKPYLRTLRFDEQERIWVLTNRNDAGFSYLDVFYPAGFAGTVRVAGRAAAFDVLGSTLAVLADRQVASDDADGIPEREIDWYDVGHLEVELARMRESP